MIGKEEQVAQLPEMNIVIQQNHSGTQFSVRGVNVAELLIPPHSSVIGKNLIKLGFRKRYKLTAIALHRGGTNFRTEISTMKLSAGDALLITGDDDQIQELRENPNYILIQSGQRDQPIAQNTPCSPSESYLQPSLLRCWECQSTWPCSSVPSYSS